MSDIQTYSGIMFDPINVNSELIDINDIAHSLSLLCRANGHFKSFYSVGNIASIAIKKQQLEYIQQEYSYDVFFMM